MSDYQAQTVTECLSTWCTLTAGHDGGHTDLREPRTARDELARIIRDGVGVWRTPLEAAEAILAALAPREVTTMAEVIAAHTADWTDWATSETDHEHYRCLCGLVEWHVNTSADYHQAHAEHVEDALAVAETIPFRIGV